MCKDLLPGLPNDIALQCLARVPFNQFRSFKSVRGAQIDLQELLRVRKSACLAQSLVVLSQVNNKLFPTDKADQVNCLVVFEPETGFWW